MSSFHAVDQRWRLLIPAEAVVIIVDEYETALAELRALPVQTRVALIGGRRLGRLAKQAGMRVDVEYVVLPSLATPVAITQVAREALRWTTATVLTVPSGVTRWHGLFWLAIKFVRALPRLLTWTPTSDRVMVGARS